MKPVFCLFAASLLAGALTVSALPRDFGEIASATRAFSLDGRWYSVGKPSDGDFVFLETLQTMGFDLSKIPPEIIRPGDFRVEVLTEIPGKQPTGTVPVSPFLRKANGMQLASGNGSIDISFGTISGSIDQAKKTLVGRGWKLSGTKNSENPLTFATIRSERETSIVLLEEKEGSFLSIRQLEK